MCGRFTLQIPPELLAEIFGLTAIPVFSPRYNIAPTQQIPVVRESTEGCRYLSDLRWGLIPHWAKNVSIGNRLINARCETVAEKPSFRGAIKHRRCIVPASGFFEWTATPSGKQPHYITMKDGNPLCFAGIWESWHDPNGAPLESCAILTTAANSLMSVIHERMPVILNPTDFDLWLDSSITDLHRLQQLYRPFPDDRMQEWPVSTFVNSPAHQGEECIHPAGDRD